MKTLKKLLWLAAVLLCIVSCSKEEVTEKVIEVPEGKVLVETEIVVEGVIQSKTRASSEAGYTTGDGLYDSGDKVIVAAVANDGYELAAFYDKKYPSTNLGTSYEFPAAEPRTFKAEFARKYTITVSASPTAGGTVSGGGTYRSGKPCTLTATPNAGYTFDGWYEGSTKLSSNTSYSFTVSSNRTITGKFELIKFIAVGENGYIISPTKTQQVGTDIWNAIAYGNGRYVVVGNKGSIAYSFDGTNWTMITVGKENIYDVKFLNGRFAAVFWGSTVGYSTDGINWTTHKSDVPIGTNGINWANGRYVTVGESATISYSSDGINWTTNKIGQITQYYSTVWKRVAYGNGRWVAVANNGELAYSIDGINWILLFKKNESYSNLNDVKFLNGRFILAGRGQGGRLDQSTNGEDWSFVSPTNFDFFQPTSVSIKNNTFIAVGLSGKYSTSSDGINWTNPEEIKNKITPRLYGICVMP
jgi:uncharacterized repeat protein (TIGR02543 family)